MNKIGLNKQTGWSIHEQEQDSDQIISISLTKLKGKRSKLYLGLNRSMPTSSMDTSRPLLKTVAAGGRSYRGGAFLAAGEADNFLLGAPTFCAASGTAC